jgi:hypothetical protein
VTRTPFSVLEGANDLDFLVRPADRLRAALPHVPNLRQLQVKGQVVLVPVSRGDAATWPDRLRALG